MSFSTAVTDARTVWRLTPAQQLAQGVDIATWRAARQIVMGRTPWPASWLVEMADRMIAVAQDAPLWLHAAGALKGRITGNADMEHLASLRFHFYTWIALNASLTDRTTT